MTIGQQILRGDVLYANVFDHKPPGIYYLTAASLAVFGHSVAAIKVVLLGWSLATLFAFYFLARRLLEDKAALLAVAILSLLVTPTWLEGDIFGSEILMILPTCTGILLGLKGRPFLAGLFFGLSLLLKVPAIFDFGAFFMFVALGVTRGDERRTLSELGRLSAGLLAPILVTVAYFAAAGALSEYFEAAFIFNIDYTRSGNEFLFDHTRLVLNALPAALVVAVLAVRTAQRWRMGEGGAPDAFQLMVLWLAFSFYGVLLGGRPYEHYLIQAAPPFALLASFVLTCSDRRRYLAAGALVAVLAIARDQDFDVGRRSNVQHYLDYNQNFIEYAVGDKGFDEYADHFDPRTTGNYRVASDLREDSGGINASLYLFSNQPAVYFRARMDPASKYIVFYHIAWDEKRKQETVEEVAEIRPRYIIAEGPPVGAFLQLERMIAGEYRPTGSEGVFRVYTRIE